MTPAEVEARNEVERRDAAVRRLREVYIHESELALIPSGAHSDLVRLVEKYLSLTNAERAALLASLESPGGIAP